MTRREFSVALAGVSALPLLASGDSPQVVILEAIAGARLPETLSITTGSSKRLRRGLWELRTYRGAGPALAKRLARIFPRAGIRATLQNTDGGNLTYFIPFENLTARDRAWIALNADPEWIGTREQFQSYHFGLYRSV